MGTTTEAQICNIALLRIGDRQTITSLTQNSAPAKACAPLYGPARDALLEMFPWSFAEREVALALVDGYTKKNWAYIYALPGDCSRAEYIWAGLRNPPPELRPPFKIALGDSQAARGNPVLKILCTDTANATLIYTSTVTNPSLFTGLFVQALAWRLAADLALAIPSKNRLAEGLEQKFLRAFATAAAADLNQQQGDQPTESESIRVRSGTSTFPRPSP